MANAKAEERLGFVVRQLREERNMSVRMLASLTDFSPSFISQLENGQASPSISSLERIASALGVSLPEFFEPSDARTSSVVRADKRSRLESGWSKATLESLTAGRSGSLNPLIITLQPEGASGKRAHSTTREEFAFVLEGEVILTLNEEEFSLQRGDAVSILANTPRRWRNAASHSAQILVLSPRS
jgi:transcriptional regulator with XRE-family HTH domain